MNETEILLTQVAEECCEVGQRVSKALRFGLSQVQPGHQLDNAGRIRQEMDDLLGVVGLLEQRGVLPPSDPTAVYKKKDKVLRYLDFSMGRAPHP